MEHLDQHDHPVINALRARLAPPHVKEGEVASVWAQVQARLADAPVLNVATTARTNTYVWRYMSIAAALAIGFFAIKQIPNIIHTTPAPITKTYATDPGQRAKITLTDGSTIILAPATTIRYAQDFGKSNRIVELDGNALFTVTHSDGAPFVVRVARSETRVLGTSFTVRKYPTDSMLSVVVGQGKVALAGVVLTTGEEGLQRAGTHPIRRRADVTTQLAWTTGMLVFKEKPLRDVIPELERWYNLQFRVSNPRLLNATVTTSLDAEPSSEMLELIGAAVRANVVRAGSVVTLTAR